MTIRDFVERMDGWSEVRIDRYSEDTGRGETVYMGDGSDVPEDLEDLEIQTIHIYGNMFGLDCE